MFNNKKKNTKNKRSSLWFDFIGLKIKIDLFDVLRPTRHIAPPQLLFQQFNSFFKMNA
jgi:hypothetical protein